MFFGGGLEGFGAASNRFHLDISVKITNKNFKNCSANMICQMT